VPVQWGGTYLELMRTGRDFRFSVYIERTTYVVANAIFPNAINYLLQLFLKFQAFQTYPK